MKSRLIKSNKFFPLLTDTLPYEVPVLFSNKGFYHTIKLVYDNWYNDKMKKKSKTKEKEFINKQKNNLNSLLNEDYSIQNFLTDVVSHYLSKYSGQFSSKILDKGFIPYDYMIQKNTTKLRKISLIHPISQLIICDLYTKFGEELIYYTNKSNVSLRYPQKKATHIFRQHDKLLNKLISQETKKATEFTNLANNYFVYKKYRHIYAFYDSNELQDYEQKYRYCFKFDIKRCFESIYTHSITWAIKDKNYCKQHKSNDNLSFEDNMDKIVQRSNWNETHGIPIGAEFSRIFAEIILQQIDINVEHILLSEKFKVHNENIKKGKDFIIKRYVDDYFIFVNSKELGEIILEKYEQALLEYKLFPNQDKFVILERPFLTPISIAKQKIIPKLKEVFNKIHFSNSQETELSEKNLFLTESNLNVKEIINEIRVIVSDKNIFISDIANIVLPYIKNELIKILNVILPLKFNQVEAIHKQRIIKNSRNFLNNILDLSFYIFHLNSKANTAYGICKICFEVLKIIEIINNNRLTKEIEQKIYTSLSLFLENQKNSSNPIIDYLDIIWIIEKLGDYYALNREQLMIFFNKSKDSYFELIVLLSYTGRIYNSNNKNKEYEKIIDEIYKKIFNLFETNKENWYLKADLFMMFFDIIKCPYTTKNNKKYLLSIVNITKNQNKLINFIQANDWFYDWNEQVSLDILLEIKELHNVY